MIAERSAETGGHPVATPRERFLATFTSSATREAYGCDLGQFGAFLASGKGRGRLTLVTPEEPDWGTVTRPQAAHYLAHLGELKPSTAARKWAAVRSFYRWLRREGLAATDPTERLPSPKAGDRTPRTLTDAELARLLDAPLRAYGLTAHPIRRATLLRDALMLRLWASGLRASEAAALTVGDLGHGYASVGSRHVPLDAATEDALAAYLQSRWLLLSRPTDALLVNHRGEALTRQGAWLLLQGYARGVGLERVNASTLRNTCAQHLLRSGVSPKDAATVLGVANSWSLRVGR